MVQTKLNDAQIMLLELFQHRQMTTEELKDLRKVLVKHLSQKLDIEIGRNMDEKDITFSDIENKSISMAEHRGQYLNQLRNQ